MPGIKDGCSQPSGAPQTAASGRRRDGRRQQSSAKGRRHSATRAAERARRNEARLGIQNCSGPGKAFCGSSGVIRLEYGRPILRYCDAGPVMAICGVRAAGGRGRASCVR